MARVSADPQESELPLEVPVINLAAMEGAPPDRQALAEQVQQVFHEIGFLVVSGHGVDTDLIDRVFSYAHDFFALPPETKALIDKQQSPHFRGWEPVGAEMTNNRPDIREQIDLWSEHAPAPAGGPSWQRLLGPNQWMPEDALPGFRATMDRWFREMGDLADRLLGLLAEGLGLPSDHFVPTFGRDGRGGGMSLTKIIHYPETPADGFGVNAHHDTGFITLLATDGTPGLEVEMSDGSWRRAPTIPGTLIINLGEMLQAMTGNYLVATPHRVTTSVERYSLGYFHGPALETPLTLLPLDQRYAAAVAASPRHQAAGYMAQADETEAGVGDMQSRHAPDTYGQQLWNYFRRSYPENMRRHHPDLMDDGPSGPAAA